MNSKSLSRIPLFRLIAGFIIVWACIYFPAQSTAQSQNSTHDSGKTGPQTSATEQKPATPADSPVGNTKKESVTQSGSPAKTNPKGKQTETPEEKKARLDKFEHDADIKKAEWIEQTMDYGIQKDRRDAINFIPTVKDPDKKKLLGQKLITLIGKEQDSTVLVKALTVASDLNLSESVDVIKEKINDQSEDVRIAAVYALKDMKAQQTKPVLIEQLQKQDFSKPSNFTEAMIQTLSDFKATELKDFAVEKIKDNKTTTGLRLALILFLGRSGTVESKDFLLKTFKDEDEETDIRSYAVNALARLDVKESIPEINKVLDDINAYPFAKKKQYANLQAYCVSALVKLGDANAFPRLLDSLKSDNATTRLRGIKLIKDLGDKRAIDILKYKMNYDPSPQVQKAAKEALKSMDVDVGDEKKTSEKNPAVKTDPKSKPDPAEEQPEEVKKREDF